MPTIYRRKGNDGKPLKAWYFSYRNAEGKRIVRKGFTDKASTESLAKRMEDQERKIRTGLLSSQEIEGETLRSAPVRDVVERYRNHLERKGGTHRHIRQTINAINNIFGRSSIPSLARMDGGKLLEVLGEIARDRSPRTANYYRGVLKGFLGWCFRMEYLPRVPYWIDTLPKRNENLGRKKNRRSLTDQEALRLIEGVKVLDPVVTKRRGRGGRPLTYLTGGERSLVYLLALETGLRANEIRYLTPDHFVLSNRNLHIILKAEGMKNRRSVNQPIPRSLARELRQYLRNRPPTGKAFDLPEKCGKMLKADLEKIGIPELTREGEIDFHSLRTTFITNLSRKGVSPAVAQRLARHSTITLTIDVYTKIDDRELREAIER